VYCATHESPIPSNSMRWNPRSPAIELDRQGRSRRRFERIRGSARFTRRPDRSMLAGPVASPRPRPRPRSRHRGEEEDALEREMGSTGVNRERQGLRRSETERETERTTESWRKKKSTAKTNTKSNSSPYASPFLFRLHSPPLYRTDLLTSCRPSSTLCPSYLRRFFILHRLLPSVSPTFAHRRHRRNCSKFASSSYFSSFPSNSTFNACTRSRLFEFAVLPIKSFVCR